MMKNTAFLSLFLFSAFVLRATAQDSVVSPKPGDPVLKALFNVLRPAVEKKLHQKVIFQVDMLKMQKGWAFLRGRPLQPDQKPINYAKTEYQEAVKLGMFDDGYSALLHKTGKTWKLITYNVGATDVVYEPWAAQYHAPPAIFK